VPAAVPAPSDIDELVRLRAEAEAQRIYQELKRQRAHAELHAGAESDPDRARRVEVAVLQRVADEERRLQALKVGDM